MIFENQLYWNGANNKAAENAIRHEFSELYFPVDEHWRTKAMADCRQAIGGILNAYGILH
jgi:hypothetical protein